MIFQATRRWWDDTRGGLTAFTVMVFMLMFLAIGMAVDLMRHETMRAELQFAVDRGVLAASSMSQTMDEEATVRGYIQSTNFAEDASYNLDVDAVKKVDAFKGNVFRRVEASADYDFKTHFLRLVGIDTLKVNVSSVAQQGAQDIELSLVLDVSQSMVVNNDDALRDSLAAALFNNPDSVDAAGDDAAQDASAGFAADFNFAYGLDWHINSPTRLDVVKQLSQQFIENVYDNAFAERTSVSIVPFSGAVNPGRSVFDSMVDTVEHSYSNCLEMIPEDFNRLGLPFGETRLHVPEFNVSIYGASDLTWGYCPKSNSEITYFQNDKDQLKAKLAKLEASDGTATHHGMKWGAALLDPSAQSLINGKISASQVPPEFSGRPYTYFSGQSEKIIVLFSDGITRDDVRPKPDKYLDPAVRLELATALDSNRMKYDLANAAPQDSNLGYVTRESGKGSGYTLPVDTTRSDLRRVCDEAKGKGIRIFTVGFDLGTSASGADALSDLAYCANDNRHVFNTTNAGELMRALEEIAAFVDVLRLKGG